MWMNNSIELQILDLKIWLVPCFVDNYIFIIHHASTNTTVVVDPGDGLVVESFIHDHGFNLDEIWITHHHSDHINGVLYLKNKYLCEVRGSIQIKDRIPGVSIPVKEGSTWQLGNWTLNVLELPGHTLDHIAYWMQHKDFHTLHSFLFSGDVLFGLGCGRLFEGTYEQMIDSLLKITKLPPHTKIFCSHEYTEKNLDFTIKQSPDNSKMEGRKVKILEMRSKGIPTVPLDLSEELETNLFLLSLNTAGDPNRFIKLRELRNQF